MNTMGETHVTARLQSQVQAHKEKIESISAQLKEMSKLLTELPTSMEKTMTKMLKDHLKPQVIVEEADDEEDSSKAELYFQVHKTPTDQKLKLSQMCMDGSALHWFTNLLIRHPNTTWEQFRLKLLNRFSGTRYRNAHEALGSLFQEEGVEEYIENFEELSALIADQSEEQSIGWFLRGLKTEIRNWVRTLNPSSCNQAMELARNVESAMGGRNEKPSYRPRSGNTHTYSSLPSFKSRSPSKNNLQSPLKPTYVTNSSAPNQNRPPDKPNFGNPPRTPNVRHLTSSEWEERRKKGFCFKCGQRYSPQHKCADGGLRILLLAAGETLGADGEVHNAEVLSDEEEDPEGACNSLELSSGPTNPSCSLSTIKLVGEINGVPVLILVDNGATHNFLSKRLAIALGLHVSPIKRACIKMGDDRRVWMTEGCTGIPIKLGSYSLNADALVYDLGSLDLILGIAWLKTLGDVLCNWASRSIQFWDNGEMVKLQGISSTQEGLSSILSCVEDSHEHRNIPSP
ncbi:hypothetical protein LXL04_001157 [Taraxacum kok-saghyz]